MTAPLNQNQSRDTSAYREESAAVPFRGDATRDALIDVLEESVRHSVDVGSKGPALQPMFALAIRFDGRTQCDREIVGAMLTTAMMEFWKPFFERSADLRERIISAITEAMLAHPPSTRRLEQLWRLVREQAARTEPSEGP